MAKNKISIIGAGPGGLTAAMILSHRGYDVTVFEKESFVGGRNGELKLDDYSFDIGPTFLMMKYFLDDVFEMSGKNIDDYIDFVKLDPMYVLNFGDKKVSISSDKEKTIRELDENFPGESNGFKKFLKKESHKFKVISNILTKSYSSFFDLFSLDMLKALPYLGIRKSVYDIVSEYFKDERLKLAFTFQSKYLGMSPWVCPGGFSIIPYVEHEFGMWHVQGGLCKISEAMASVCKENGVKFKFNSKIKKIKIENGEAKGVVLENGDVFDSDFVVINSDFAYSMNELFEGGELRKYSNKKIEEKDYSCSTFMIYLGLNKVYDEPHHQIVFSDDYKNNLEEIFETGQLSEDMSFYIRNSSINDPNVAPEGHSSLYILIPVSNKKISKVDWVRETSGFREKIISLIKKKTSMGDIENHIVEEKIFTPDTWEKDFNVYRGATFNLSHKISQMLYFRPHNKFEEIDNCYLVGGGTHPGSGLPTIYESGRIVANMISNKK